MPLLLTTSPPGSPEWKAARRGKITASTVASIAVGDIEGVKTYGTPYSEWLRLTEELKGNDPPEEEFDEFSRDAMDYGNASEEFHRQLLSKKSGLCISSAIGTWQHDELDYLVATVDCMVHPSEDGIVWPSIPPEDWPITGELKAVTEFGMAKWAEGTPLFFQVQGLTQALVMKKDAFLVSGLIPPTPKYQTFPVDPAQRDWLLETIDTFWHKHVLADIPPEITGKDLDLLAGRYQPRAGLIVPGTLEHARLVEDWNEAKAAIKVLEETEKSCKARIVAALGFKDAEGNDVWADALRLPDGSGITYKETRRVNPPRLEETVSVFRTPRHVKKV